jgi:hypothetical protein
LKKEDVQLVTGVAWNKADQWPALYEASVDRDALEDTHEEWLKQAQKTLVELGRQGVRTERVEIDVGELVEWCRRHGRDLDGKARAEFTTRQLRMKHEQEDV